MPIDMEGKKRAQDGEGNDDVAFGRINRIGRMLV